MKQQQLERQIATALKDLKEGKFGVEFALMLMASGRETEASWKMEEGLKKLASAIETLEGGEING